ncbi:hypothetical protein PAMC26577_14195 [Caballeronia sordidicola]|uniref:Uncharacterized protein n=1 Tax=Caballeronia sordidicola TaxID=196367 RepID=A0A242MUA4_CABSO|nr:hypothetical protein PAMC26577_14195 [Caballeronia sordidicola]
MIYFQILGWFHIAMEFREIEESMQEIPDFWRQMRTQYKTKLRRRID